MTIECVIPQKFHRSIMGPKGTRIQQITRDHNVQIKFPEREEQQGKTIVKDNPIHYYLFFSLMVLFPLLAAPPSEAPIQENGEANGEVKEPVDPNAPKKCDVILISGRKERCEAAVEALKVGMHNKILFDLLIIAALFTKMCSLVRRWFLSLLRWKCLLSFIDTSLDRKEVEFAR